MTKQCGDCGGSGKQSTIYSNAGETDCLTCNGSGSMNTPEAMTREEFYNKHGITYKAEFVPQSKSRNADNKDRSINWIVIIFNGRGGLITDYMQGIGNMIGYNAGRKTLEDDGREKMAAEQGKVMRFMRGGVAIPSGKLPEPKINDVMYSLVMDSSVLDYSNFENWCSEFGYDTDSIKAKKIYKACMKIALQLRGMLTDAGLNTLRELFQDY